MPRNPIDYSKTIIYKICCNDINIKEVYIGHTTDFKSRKNNHKKSCNNPIYKEYNFNVYQFIRNNGGWDNWSIIMIEEYPCNSKLEAEKKERYWIEELEAKLNKTIPTRTCKERYEENKDKVLEKFKDYEIKNKEYRKEYHKLKYEKNKEEINKKRKEKIKCECGFIGCKANLYRHIQTKKHRETIEKTIT